MAEILRQRELPSTDILVVEPPVAPPSHVHSPKAVPIFKLSPSCNGSSLYDSYEFRAVRQCNKAMQGSSITSSPALVSFLRSPFYSQLLDSIYKDSTSTPKKVTCSRFVLSDRSHNRRASSRGITTRAAGEGFVRKLWKKVKQGLLIRNK